MVIDMHGHWLSAGLKEWGWNLVTLRNASASAFPKQGIDEENDRNLRCMDERGIDMQILSIRPVSMLHTENPYIGIPWARVFNNVLAEAAQRRPERLRAMATLPQCEMEATVAELERAVRQLGMVGAIVNPNPRGDDLTPPLDDEYWFPLYQKAVDLDVPIFLHAASLRGPRYLRHRTSYLIGQTVEETVAGPTLVYGGVLDRFPTLRIILCHGGGATPYQIGRYMTPPGRGSLSAESGMYGSPPLDDFLTGYRRLYFDGTLYTPAALELLVSVVGPDRILFGTETPGRGTFEVEGRKLDDLRPVWESMESLTPAERQMVLEGNARRVFRL